MVDGFQPAHGFFKGFRFFLGHGGFAAVRFKGGIVAQRAGGFQVAPLCGRLPENL
ncbi:hypothetical protein EIKCOROL_01393 [Eikenella corrodens ATCC 23834]|uniref:Uncharacterized protein n=1 Tax=Eikenella corrodens ATCC 23834 TaxID=546274 RepID=C0DVK5_EIKCO|nr:hypothetical protein EIKCOROL_01393 [Eikenella corrodens ATCC 23834]